MSIAPIYDCGSCLLPQADEKVMQAVLENENELNARIYRFPTSAIKQNDKKINYYDFLTNTDNEDCLIAIKRIASRVDLNKIGSFIDSVPYISDLQKEFYKRYIGARFDKILRPAYNRAVLKW